MTTDEIIAKLLAREEWELVRAGRLGDWESTREYHRGIANGIGEALELLKQATQNEAKEGRSMMTKPASKFVHPLGLSKVEWRLMMAAIRSRRKFGIEDYLPSDGKPTQAAIDRLVERGFLTLSGANLLPPHPGWRVVRITDENMVNYNRAMAATAPQEEAPCTT